MHEASMSVWRQLKERNVFKVGTAYLAVAWLITQVVANLKSPLGLPDRFDTIVVVLLAIGFPIALIIAWAFELTPEGIRRTDPESGRGARTPPPRGHRLNYLITAALVLAVGFLLVDRFLPGGASEHGATAASDPTNVQLRAESDGASSTSPAVPPLDERTRLAVLPLRALTTNDELGVFADGLSEQLISELRQIPELLVVDRASSFAFRGSPLSQREIADRLGVGHLLDGTIASTDDRLRVSVTLTRVSDDAQLWADTFDFERGDIFAIQDEITQQVATALSVSLGVLNSREPGMTRNVEAYMAYLTALGYGQHATVDSLRSAITLAQRAIALDPDFFQARIGLYSAFAMGTNIVPKDEAETWQRNADEALALARERASGPTELGIIETLDAVTNNDWAAAETLLTRNGATGLRAANAIAVNAALGSFRLSAGRVRDAIGYLETARALAPLGPELAALLGSAYADAGDTDAAYAEFDRGLAIEPSVTLVIGATLILPLATHDIDELNARLAKLPAQNAPGTLWRSLADLADDRDAALAEIRRRLDASTEETAINIGLLAHWANFFGDPDLALEIMRALPLDTPFLPLMLWDPGMAEVRKLPGFKTLVTDLDLVDYWREYGWPDFCQPAGDDFTCE
jgi:TolB-like protein